MVEKAKTGPGTAVVEFKEATVEVVLKRVQSLKEVGGLALPPAYSAENALRSAWLMLQETKDQNKKPVLVACSKDSIANTLFGMVAQGLNPMKKQCAFIARGGKLTLQRMYAGSIALARRFGDVKEINAGIVYEGDVFKYSIDPVTGRKKITKHEQEAENIIEAKIKYVYAVAVFNDGTTDMLPMTMAQVRTSWSQGELGGKGPAHLKFISAMARKTVINAICKVIIDSSDDSALMMDDDQGHEESPLANAGEVIEIPEEEEEIQVAEEVIKVDEKTGEIPQDPPF